MTPGDSCAVVAVSLKASKWRPSAIICVFNLALSVKLAGPLGEIQRPCEVLEFGSTRVRDGDDFRGRTIAPRE